MVLVHMSLMLKETTLCLYFPGKNNNIAYGPQPINVWYNTRYVLSQTIWPHFIKSLNMNDAPRTLNGGFSLCFKIECSVEIVSVLPLFRLRPSS